MNKLDRFLNENVALHCPTEELADKLMQFCEDNNIIWDSGCAALSYNNFSEYGKDSCYILGKDCRLEYASTTFYKDGGYTVLELTLDDFKPKSYIEQVAKMFGVEVGEKFDVVFDDGDVSPYSPHKFENDKLIDNEGDSCDIYLGCLIMGKYKIKKITPYAKPIKCKRGDVYSYIDFDGEIRYTQYVSAVYDCAMSLIGNMFAPNAIIPQDQIDEMVNKLKGEL